MPKLSTGADVESRFRRALNDLLRESEQDHLSDDEWVVLRDRGYARDFASQDADVLREAFAFVDDARRMHGAKRMKRDQRPMSASSDAAEPSAMWWHDRALSEVFVAHAMEEDVHRRIGIVAFRRKAFDGGTLSRADAGPWVIEQAKREGAATVIKERTATRESSRVKLLAYGIEGDEWAHHIPVREGGLLDQLGVLSKKLADFYGWTPAQASFFVLTGGIPWVSSFKSTTQRKVPLSARERIKLNIHPTCTPQEVARFYSEIRREHYGRLRRLSPKHSMLAAFYAAQPEKATPSELLRDWNARCDRERWSSDWRYKKGDADLLHRDMKDALLNLAELAGARRG